ncbi:hypothetical protein PENTCL1PPCAC_15362, partial [Pristionchus entomophagus]
MSAEQCEVLRDLSSDIEYQTLIAIKFIISMLGACGVSYQWRKHGVSYLVHDNTKVVFKYYLFMCVLMVTVYALLYLFELLRLRFDCFVINFRTILLSKGIAICATVSAHHVLLIISVERLFAAVFPAHFEKFSNKRLAHILALVKVGVYGNVFSLLIYVFDVYLNLIRKPATVNHSLSISYQRSENRRVLFIILPLEFAEAILYFATVFALILQEKVNIPTEHVLYLELFALTVFTPLILAIIIELQVARR